MDAQIAVGDLQQTLKIVEAERVIYGQSADNAESHTLMNDGIEAERLGTRRAVRTISIRSRRWLITRTDCLPTHRASSQ